MPHANLNNFKLVHRFGGFFKKYLTLNQLTEYRIPSVRMVAIVALPHKNPLAICKTTLDYPAVQIPELFRQLDGSEINFTPVRTHRMQFSSFQTAESSD
jgi:hypothetical protein